MEERSYKPKDGSNIFPQNVAINLKYWMLSEYQTTTKLHDSTHRTSQLRPVRGPSPWEVSDVSTNRFYRKKIWVRRMSSYLGDDCEISVGWTRSSGALRCWPAAVITSHHALRSFSLPATRYGGQKPCCEIHTDVLLNKALFGMFSRMKDATGL
jgi:hypothetical protein